MTWRATFAGLRTLLLGYDGRDSGQSLSQPNSDTSSIAKAMGAEPPQKPDGAALLNQRAWMIHRARQEKPRSEAKARLISQAYSMTHDILRRGPDA